MNFSKCSKEFKNYAKKLLNLSNPANDDCKNNYGVILLYCLEK